MPERRSSCHCLRFTYQQTLVKASAEIHELYSRCRTFSDAIRSQRSRGRSPRPHLLTALSHYNLVLLRRCVRVIEQCQATRFRRPGHHSKRPAFQRLVTLAFSRSNNHAESDGLADSSREPSAPFWMPARRITGCSLPGNSASESAGTGQRQVNFMLASLEEAAKTAQQVPSATEVRKL